MNLPRYMNKYEKTMPDKMKNRRTNWEHNSSYTIPQFSL